METFPPLEIKQKAGEALAVLTQPQVNIRLFGERLEELVAAYDSDDFEHYRESFGKLACMLRDRSDILIDNYRRVSIGMEQLRNVSREIKALKSTRTPADELIFIVGGVYTDLRVMALHQEEIDAAFVPQQDAKH